MSSNIEYKVLRYQLSEKLHQNEVDGISSIYLPSKTPGESGLNILLKLEMQGVISATNPSSLEEVFKNINRMDLVKKVKEFVKSQKKGRKRCTKSVEEEVVVGLSANLEVALAQFRLLQDQLKYVKEKAEETGNKYIEDSISDITSNIKDQEKKLKACAKEMATSESSESDDSSSPPISNTNSNCFEKELQQHCRKMKGKHCVSLPACSKHIFLYHYELLTVYYYLQLTTELYYPTILCLDLFQLQDDIQHKK